MNGTITSFNNRVSSLFLFFSCRVVINGNLKATANQWVYVFVLKLNTRYIEVEEYTNMTFSDIFHIFYSSQLSYSSHSKSLCPFQYIASYNTANHPPPPNHYKIIIREMNEYTDFKNYTLYRYDSSHYYCK